MAIYFISNVICSCFNIEEIATVMEKSMMTPMIIIIIILLLFDSDRTHRMGSLEINMYTTIYVTSYFVPKYRYTYAYSRKVYLVCFFSVCYTLDYKIKIVCCNFILQLWDWCVK